MISYSYIAALIANIISFTIGTTLSWSSPVTAKLDITNITNASDDYPFDNIVSKEEKSLIGSLVALGAVFGPAIFGICADKIGRKWTLLSLGIPFLTSYLVLAFAETVPLYYFARALAGLAVGGFFTVMPMYMSEIADDTSRGTLGSFINVYLCFGLLISYCIGSYVSLMTYNIILAVVPGVYMVLFFILGPESPHYYVSKGDIDSATLVLEKLRGASNPSIKNELENIKTSVEKAKEGTISDLFKSKGVIKALIISLSLVGLQQFSGINAVLFYAQTIFKKAGSELEPAICSIIVGAVQFSTSFVTPILSDKLGRKILLYFSAVGMIISEVPLGLYLYLDANGTDVSNISWLPIVSMVFYIITYNSGFGPLPWVVMAELFPPHVKSIASSLTASFCWIIGFIITMFFESIADAIGMGPSFWIFAGFCVIAFVFTLFVVVETKGKSFPEIQELLES